VFLIRDFGGSIYGFIDSEQHHRVFAFETGQSVLVAKLFCQGHDFLLRTVRQDSNTEGAAELDSCGAIPVMSAAALRWQAEQFEITVPMTIIQIRLTYSSGGCRWR